MRLFCAIVQHCVVFVHTHARTGLVCSNVIEHTPLFVALSLLPPSHYYSTPPIVFSLSPPHSRRLQRALAEANRERAAARHERDSSSRYAEDVKRLSDRASAAEARYAMIM
jgi:hypothetical protein